MRTIPCCLIALHLLVPSMAGAEGVIRHKLPNNSTFPIAAAVEVPAGATTVYLSGKVPPVIDDKAPRDSVAAYGNTERQTVGVLGAIRDQLKSLGLGMGDISSVAKETMGYARENGAGDSIDEIVASIPGLSQFV